MHYTGILCGNFSTRGAQLTPEGHDAKWQHAVKSDQERNIGHRYYYSRFYDVCFGDKSQGIDGFNRYVYDLDAERGEVTLKFGERQYKVRVERLGIYICPFDIALFSIMVSMKTDDYDDISRVMFQLRNIMNYDDNESIKPFVDVAVEPIMSYCSAIGDVENAASRYEHLMLYGNKLKIFQIVNVKECDSKAKFNDRSLYDLATLSLKPNGAKALDGMSDVHFNKIMAQNSLSVYNNWMALSLIDSFTILGVDISDSNRCNWIDNYFGMIYLYCLFVKVYLFALNNDYDAAKRRSRRSMISETYDDFETKYYFIDISYNFLPRMIDDHISKALEIESEKSRVYERIERQNMIREKRADSRMNRLLFVITSLTLFSAIWDGASLINEMFPYKEFMCSTAVGFRFVSLCFMLLVTIFCLLTFRRRR